MIRCELQLNSILGQQVRARHDPCIVSSEGHVSDYHASEPSSTPAVLNSEYKYIYSAFQRRRYIHEDVQMLVRRIEGPCEVADGAERAQVHLHDMKLGAWDLVCEALLHLLATL